MRMLHAKRPNFQNVNYYKRKNNKETASVLVINFVFEDVSLRGKSAPNNKT